MHKMASRSRICYGILFDVSGTLHIGDELIPGAVQALKRVHDTPSVAYKLVTNTTKESGTTLHNRLIRLGFETKREDLFTSLTAARKFIVDNKYRPMLILEDDALNDFQGIDTADPNCVVIGLAPSQFHYERLNDAFQLLLNGAEFLAIHKARYFKREMGLALGPGPFVQGLEFATDRKAKVVGKPEPAFFLSALSMLNTNTNDNGDTSTSSPITPNNAFVIGDDIRDDVMGAQNAGMRGVLVKTGKYRVGDELKGDAWKVVDDVAQAVQVILDEIGSGREK